MNTSDFLWLLQYTLWPLEWDKSCILFNPKYIGVYFPQCIPAESSLLADLRVSGCCWREAGDGGSVVAVVGECFVSVFSCNSKWKYTVRKSANPALKTFWKQMSLLSKWCSNGKLECSLSASSYYMFLTKLTDAHSYTVSYEGCNIVYRIVKMFAVLLQCDNTNILSLMFRMQYLPFRCVKEKRTALNQAVIGRYCTSALYKIRDCGSLLANYSLNISTVFPTATAQKIPKTSKTSDKIISLQNKSNIFIKKDHPWWFSSRMCSEWPVIKNYGSGFIKRRMLCVRF